MLSCFILMYNFFFSCDISCSLVCFKKHKGRLYDDEIDDALTHYFLEIPCEFSEPTSTIQG